MNNIILDSKYSESIFYLCFVHLVTIGYIYHRKGFSRGFFIVTLVTCTSIVYWYHPTKESYRRYVDIFCVNVTILYHMYIGYSSIYWFPFYTYYCVGILCYPISKYYSKHKLYWESTAFHMLLHCFAFMGNMILYSDPSIL
jgi:hypothetical protein